MSQVRVLPGAPPPREIRSIASGQPTSRKPNLGKVAHGTSAGRLRVVDGSLRHARKHPIRAECRQHKGPDRPEPSSTHFRRRQRLKERNPEQRSAAAIPRKQELTALLAAHPAERQTILHDWSVSVGLVDPKRKRSIDYQRYRRNGIDRRVSVIRLLNDRPERFHTAKGAIAP